MFCCPRQKSSCCFLLCCKGSIKNIRGFAAAAQVRSVRTDLSEMQPFIIRAQQWVGPRRQWNPQLPTHFPPVGQGENQKGEREKKLVDWDKDSLIDKAKLDVQPKQNKEVAYSFPSGGRCSQESGASSCPVCTWEGKHHSHGYPLFFLHLPAFIAEWDAIWHGISLWPPAFLVSLPSFAPTPPLLPGRPEWEKENNFGGAVQVLLSNRWNINS